MHWTCLRVAETAIEMLQATGGFTLHPTLCRSPRQGWAVSLSGGHRHRVELTAVQIASLFHSLLSNAPPATAGREVYLGGWRDPETGELCIDLTILIDDREEALAFAESQGQKAIYNLATNETAYVPVFAI